MKNKILKKFAFLLVFSSGIFINQELKAETITVTSEEDNATSATTPGTLRHALLNVPDGGTITFSNAVKTIRILPYTPFRVKKASFTIEGNSVCIFGNRTQIMYADLGKGHTVTIKRLKFENGGSNNDWNEYDYEIINAPFGGAVYLLSGEMNFYSCVFVNNKVEGGNAMGGALAITNKASMSVFGCTFMNNSVNKNIRNGASIYNDNSTLIVGGNLFQTDFATLGKNEEIGKTDIIGSASIGSHQFDSKGYNIFGLTNDDINKEGWSENDILYDNKDTYTCLCELDGTLNSRGETQALIVPENFEGMPAYDFYGNTRIIKENKQYAGAIPYGSVSGFTYETIDSDFTVSGGKGIITIKANTENKICIYNMAGCLLQKSTILAGETKTISMPQGVYIVNKHKIAVM